MRDWCQRPTSKMGQKNHRRWGLCSTTHCGDAPARAGASLEALRGDHVDVPVCSGVCGMVHAGLRVLSLSMEEDRSTFGAMARTWAKF